MKITVTKAALLNGLQMVHGIVGTRTTLPILSNVMLQAEQNKLWMTTTDLDISIRCVVEADVERKGSTTLPARRLLSIVRELPSDSVNLEVDEKHAATISCGSAYYRILGLTSDEFPALPAFSGGYSYTIDRVFLKEMLQKTGYAASTDEMRLVLNGNLFSFRDEKLLIVATDGRRLALAEQELEFPKEAETDIIVPTKAVNELIRSVQGEGPMKIHVVKNQIAFEFGDVLMLSKLIEGQFPNFRQVIPTQSEHRIPLNRELLLNAVRRMAILTNDKSSAIRVAFSKNKLTISVSAQDVGEAHEDVPVKYAGKEMAIAFNPDFLMDPLRNVTQDEINLEITDELSPGVIKCEEAFLYVIMPMRIT